MARKPQEPIRVKAYVTVNGEEVDVDTLSSEMRNELGARLTVQWMNAMFRGKAVFHAGTREEMTT